MNKKMTLAEAIEKVHKLRVLWSITDGEKSDRVRALDMLLDTAREKMGKDGGRWQIMKL